MNKLPCPQIRINVKLIKIQFEFLTIQDYQDKTNTHTHSNAYFSFKISRIHEKCTILRSNLLNSLKF